MNSSTVKWVVGFVAFAFILVACCFGVPLWINHLLIARLDGPSFTTDQVIASLGVMVTALGLFIALAAVGIAVLAAVGYAELRSTVERNVQKQTEESEKRLKEEILSLAKKKMFSSDKDEDEKVADLAERVESAQIPIESRTPMNTDLRQVAGTTENAESGPPQVKPIVKEGSAVDVPQSGILPEGNLSAGGNVVGTGAEQPIAGEYPQGKEDEEP